MKIARKSDEKPQYKEEIREWKIPDDINHRTHKIVYDEPIPGKSKYSGKTLGWVKENDESYWHWLYTNRLYVVWGLTALREPEKPKRTGIGEEWSNEYRVLEMIIVDQPSTPVEQSWLNS